MRSTICCSPSSTSAVITRRKGARRRRMPLKHKVGTRLSWSLGCFVVVVLTFACWSFFYYILILSIHPFARGFLGGFLGGLMLWCLNCICKEPQSGYLRPPHHLLWLMVTVVAQAYSDFPSEGVNSQWLFLFFVLNSWLFLASAPERRKGVDKRTAHPCLSQSSIWLPWLPGAQHGQGIGF